jgi:predicted nucleic acid-binding Zn ribbon protein
VEPRRRRRSLDEDDSPQAVSDVLQGWLTAHGLTELRALGTIRNSWCDLVGEEIARHSIPRSLKDKRLVVTVDHGGWVTELRFQEGRILRLLEAQLGAGIVERLDARVDASPGLEYE